MEKEIKDWSVGDILYAANGYNRTDVEFYLITERTDKRFTLSQLKSKVVDGDPLRVYHVEPTNEEIGVYQKGFINKKGYPMIIGRKPEWYQPYLLNLYVGKPVWANTGYQC